VRGQQQIFETAFWYDYVLAAVIAAPLAAVAGFFVVQLIWFSFILAPVVGGAIAEVVRWAVRRRRGRYLSLVAVGGFVLGCLPLVVVMLVGRGGMLTGLVLVPLYMIIGASTLYARLRGISI
jgi:hypothetical protein